MARFRRASGVPLTYSSSIASHPKTGAAAAAVCDNASLPMANLRKISRQEHGCRTDAAPLALSSAGADGVANLVGVNSALARELPAFRRQLLQWYERNKRELDWRATKDPYRIWISEIMLQQTRVAAVIPYYRRFLERFPTVQDLAKARGDVMLRYWSGLGYYSRARNMHRAAKQIVERHGGKFPADLENTLALPGVGRYTAAAVLSIAYGHPVAVLDGNVARVLARMGAIRGDLRQPRRWRQLAGLSGALLEANSPGDWNQAMMELGATICTPRTPRCEACPVARWCRARRLGIAGELPAAPQKAKAVRVNLAAAVLLDQRGRTLLIREADEDGALFSNLWQFPAVKATGAVGEKLSRHLELALGVVSPKLRPLASARHTVTFRRIELAPFLVRVKKLPAIAGARTPRLSGIERLPISNATRKIAAAALLAISDSR
jgi:A/G-specific adenine glycosylase